MDTLNLRLFVMAAEKLNISKAGQMLGMAPAVASARLAKLEHAVGADLLHRSTRRVALSLEGQEFLPYARDILAQEDAALAALGHGTKQVNGNLRFAAPSTFAQTYIAPVLPGFLDRYPDIELDLRLSDGQVDLIEGSFDLALRNQAAGDSSLKARKLADDTRVLCASPSYLAAHGTPVVPEDLNVHRLIAFKDLQAKPLRHSNGETAVYSPKSATSRLVVDDGASQRAATLAGCGISTNSLWALAPDLDAGKLYRVLPDYRLDGDVALWLVYPKSNVLTAKVRVFIDYLIETVSPRLAECLHDR